MPNTIFQETHTIINYRQYNILKILLHRHVQVLIGLFLLSALIRILFLELYWPDPAIAWDDEPDYLALASYIKSGASWISSDAPSTRPLLLSIIISPFQDLGIHSIRILLALVSSITPISIYYLSKKAFMLTHSQSLIPSLVWVFYPPAIWYSGLILTESLTALLITIVALLLITIRKYSKISLIITIGISFSCLMLSRSSYVYLPILIMISSIVIKATTTNTFINIKQWIIIAATIVIITSPVIIRNYNSIGSFIPTETRLAYGLILSNGDFNSPIIQEGGYDKNSTNVLKYAQLANDNASYAAQKSFVLLAIKQELSSNGKIVPKILFERTINFWGSRPDPFDSQVTRNDIILFIVWVPILLLFVSSFRFYRSMEFWIFMSIIFYAYITTIIFWSSPRFRFPIDSLVIILATISVLKWKLPGNYRAGKSHD